MQFGRRSLTATLMLAAALAVGYSSYSFRQPQEGSRPHAYAASGNHVENNAIKTKSSSKLFPNLFPIDAHSLHDASQVFKPFFPKEPYSDPVSDLKRRIDACIVRADEHFKNSDVYTFNIFYDFKTSRGVSVLKFGNTKIIEAGLVDYIDGALIMTRFYDQGLKMFLDGPRDKIIISSPFRGWSYFYGDGGYHVRSHPSQECSGAQECEKYGNGTAEYGLHEWISDESLPERGYRGVIKTSSGIFAGQHDALLRQRDEEFLNGNQKYEELLAEAARNPAFPRFCEPE